MNLVLMVATIIGVVGMFLLSSVLTGSRVSMAIKIAPFIGLSPDPASTFKYLNFKVRKLLINGKSAPWASDLRVQKELRKCGSEQTLTSLRFEQLIFASIATGITLLWLLLRLISGHTINPLVGVSLIPVAFIGGGGFRSWLLKESSRKRISEMESQLPAVLDLLAFAVAAGEPMITAMQRVAKTCSGELSVEVKRITTGLAVGDNFLASLDRVQKELDSQSISRAFRAIVMAIERGTPIADVLRAQAMDSRNIESRKLMTLAGKKETMMMIPVVFLILPMIVIVALYPGLMALKTF